MPGRAFIQSVSRSLIAILVVAFLTSACAHVSLESSQAIRVDPARVNGIIVIHDRPHGFLAHVASHAACAVYLLALLSGSPPSPYHPSERYAGPWPTYSIFNCASD